MAHLKINQELVTKETAQEVMEICPFEAIEYDGKALSINAGCKMCKLCVETGPEGLVVFVEDEPDQVCAVDKSLWKGIAVYAEHEDGEIHNVTLELVGKARELAQVTKDPIYVLMIGSNIKEKAEKLLYYGVDKVFVYDYPEFKDFKIDIYANAFTDFIEKTKPSAIMVGATNLGRTLAPRVAARCRTGLTADCTVLEMKKNSDLVQIRPAFGGNIMAQIVTPKHRPQFCTVRYKVFSAPAPNPQKSGEIVSMDLPQAQRTSVFEILSKQEKPREVEITEAEIIVAVGRGFKTKEDTALAEELAELLGGMTACTRPLVEAGWFDAKRQIGLSGRTVKAKLIIALGISGAVQFAAGMRNSDCIVAVNEDPNASIFDVAHYGLVGDLYEITSRLIADLKGDQSNVI